MPRRHLATRDVADVFLASYVKETKHANGRDHAFIRLDY
jgi:hypothetical protein